MYTNDEKTYIWLTLGGVGSKHQHTLVDHYEYPYHLIENWKKDKTWITSIIGADAYAKANEISKSMLEDLVKRCDKQDIQIVTISSTTYPQLLNEIDCPPTILFCKGNVRLLSTPSIAIVGTRRMTKYGEEVTEKFAKDLAMAGLTIVSGLADGVDEKAQNATLEAKGKTIAVLGGGINNIYPPTNEKLAQRIIDQGGLVMSEYLPDEKAKPYNFPIRNRIIAGLVQGVLITEATLKSGSMHTKNYALSYGKNLYVVPGRITDIYSAGCNTVIKELQGSMVLSSEDILKDYHLELKKNNECKQITLTGDETLILEIFGTDELHFDEIAKKSKIDVKKLNTLLLRMEMRDLIKKLPGNYYSK